MSEEFLSDMLWRAADEIDYLRKDRDLWKKTAIELAGKLGKKEYADAEYENQKTTNG